MFFDRYTRQGFETEMAILAQTSFAAVLMSLRTAVKIDLLDFTETMFGPLLWSTKPEWLPSI
jgi:hypothetical protein